MAQSLASSPEVIYNTLVADTAFMAEVGTYTFKSGGTAPSISIVTPGGDLPAVSKQEGVEVVIHDIGDMATKKYLTSAPDVTFVWKVFLIVWEPATGADVRAAASRIGALFPLASSLDTFATGSNLGVAFQTQVRIPSDCPILL
jgi:hypothetical protein